MTDQNNSHPNQTTFYNIDIYNDNSTGGDISSVFTTSFQSPLLLNPSHHEISVARARVPLDQIPLSQDNIPFQKWQIEIGVPNVLSLGTYTYYNSYVPQFNAIQLTPTNNFTIGINTNNLYTSTLPENQPTSNPTLTLTPKVPALPVPVAIHLGGNVGVSNTVCGLSYTAVCVDNFIVSRYVTATGAFVDTKNLREFFEMSLANVLGICMAPNSNTVYAVVYDNVNHHYLCDVFNGAQVIKSIDETGLQLGLLSISCSTNYLSFGYLNTNNNNNLVQIWSLNQVLNPVNLNTRSQPGYTATYLDSSSAFFIGLIDMGTFYMRNPMTNDLIQTYILPESLYIDRFLGSDAYGNLLVGVVDRLLENYSILAYGKQSAILRYSIAMGGNRTLVTSNMILTNIGFVNNPAPYPIFTINEYLDQINIAFTNIFSQIPQPSPSPSLAPFLSYDSTLKIININTDPSCSPSSSTIACKINFNKLLMSFFKFTSTPAISNNLGVGSRTITINNRITPQPNSTLYRFADITRVIIGTNRMGVKGDNENFNTMLVNIGDFTVDTENGIPQLIIYNPTVLRFYQLYQTTPLLSIDVFISYANRAGKVFPINISPYNSIGIKLQFRNSNSSANQYSDSRT